MKEVKKGTRWIYWFSLAIAIILVYRVASGYSNISIGLGKLISTLMPFVMGVLVAYLFYMPCQKIEKAYSSTKFLKKRARGMAIFTVYLMALLIIIFVINIMIPALSKSLGELANSLPGYYQNAIDFVNNMPDGTIIKKESVQDILENLQGFDVTKFLSLDRITSYIKGVFGIASTIFSLFVTIVISIYILSARRSIRNFIRRLNNAIFKTKTADVLNYYFDKTNEVFFRFISTQILDGVIIGAIVSIALLILKVKYAVLLGFMIGLFNLIPYFGAIIAVVIASIITIFTGGFSKAFWMVIIVIILQQIDANIINPKLLGNALKISPILVVFSVTLFGAYWGVLGMFLAVPIIAIIKIMVNDFVNYRIKKKEKEETE